MRPLVSRGLLLPPLVCAALVLVPAGTAAAAVDAGRGVSDHGASRTYDWSGPVDTDELLARLGMSDLAGAHRGAAHSVPDVATTTQQGALGHTLSSALTGTDGADVLKPLLDAVAAISVPASGHLDAAEAAAHAKAVEAANATVQERLRNLAATDRSAAAAENRSAAAADPVSDLLATIQSTVDSLLKALTSLDLGSVLGVVTGLLGTVVGVVTGLLGGLPPLPLG